MTQAQDEKLYYEQQAFSEKLAEALRAHKLTFEQFLDMPRPRTFWPTVGKLTGRSPEAAMKFYRRNEGDCMFFLCRMFPPKRRKKRHDH